MKKLLMILFCMGSVTVYTSCKKNDVANKPLSPGDAGPIMGFKDSTQLIKSIRSFYYDSATNVIMDSSVSYFHYDTVNRKITSKLLDYSNPANSDSFEYSYNNLGLLMHLENKLSSGSQDIQTEDIAYDADNVVKTVTDKQFDGQIFTYNINKTTFASGSYQLNWLEIYNTDTAAYTVNFDINKRLTSYYFYRNSDSIIYDANGNISRVMQTNYLMPYSLTGADTYILYDFVNRDTKGDQLYNLTRILYNGISDFPGETTFGVADEFQYQFTKYPALSTNINRPASGSYDPGGGVYLINFTSTPEYDSKGRLLKYRMFFNDVSVDYEDDIISYYK